MNSSIRFLIGILTVLTTVPSLSSAQEGPPRGERGEGPPPHMRGDRRDFERPMPGYMPDMPTDEQWAEVSAFMSEHSQRRWSAIQSLADDRRPLRRRVWGRYLSLQQLKKDNPKLYDTRLRQLHEEDEVFGLVENYKLTGSMDEREKLREQIRKHVSAWISAGLEERQQRLDRLEQAIEEERARLEKDKERVNAIVDARMEHVLARGADALHPEGGPPPGGGPPPEHMERRNPHSSPPFREGPRRDEPGGERPSPRDGGGPPRE